MGYNPNQHAPTREQTEFDDREVPSGVYLFGPAWLQCPSKLSWKIRADVLMGPLAGASAFVLQGRDTKKEGTRNRLYYFSRSAGLGDVELEDVEGIITERSLRNDVLGHAFKAKITKKTKRSQDRDGNWRDFVNHDFQAFHDRSEWSQAELNVAAKWEAEFRTKREASGGDSGGGDWSNNGSGSNSKSGSQEDPGTHQDDPGWGSDGWG